MVPARPVIRLLIIDDEDDLLVVLKETAHAHQFHVSLAASVDDALEQLAGGLVVDVVLCDMTMPDGGAERWLRVCGEAHPHLTDRTIVITGWSGGATSDALGGLGPDRCLFKPFAMSEVRGLAERIVASFGESPGEST